MEMSEYEVFKDSFKDVWSIVESQANDLSNLGIYNRKIISEATIFISEMMNHVKMEPLEKEFANSWIVWFVHILGRELESNLILRLFYFEKNYYENPEKTVESLISIMVAIRALETCKSGLKQNTTVYNYFKRDLPSFSKFLEKVLKTKNGEDKTNELFLLLNSIDTLAYMDKVEFKGHLKRLIDLSGDLQPYFDKSFEIAPGLLVYASDLVNRLDVPINVKKISLELHGKPCAFSALIYLKNGKVPDSSKLENAKSPSSAHLWWIAHTWAKLAIEKQLTGILPFYRHIDIDTMFNIVWGNLREIISISAAKSELNHVLTFKDQDIKNQLYEYFKNHPNLTTYREF